MNQIPAKWDDEASEKPENQQNYKDGPEHKFPSFGLKFPLLRVRSRRCAY
jgi:hypothetical protein